MLLRFSANGCEIRLLINRREGGGLDFGGVGLDGVGEGPLDLGWLVGSRRSGLFWGRFLSGGGGLGYAGFEFWVR